MALATWWSGDPLPALPPLPGLRTAVTDDLPLLARLADLDQAEVAARVAGGHRPYLAWLGAEPVAYGWVAGAGATIGELGVAFALPRGDRYLWDFATLPAWRGRGVYPHLLRGIIAAHLASTSGLIRTFGEAGSKVGTAPAKTVVGWPPGVDRRPLAATVPHLSGASGPDHQKLG